MSSRIVLSQQRSRLGRVVSFDRAAAPCVSNKRTLIATAAIKPSVQQPAAVGVSRRTTAKKKHLADRSPSFSSSAGTQADASQQHSSSFSTTSSSSSIQWSPVQQKLLHEALHNHVLTQGWTQDAIVAAAQSLGTTSSSGSMSIATAGLVTPSDLIAYCMQEWNERLRTELQSYDWNDDGNSQSSSSRLVDRLATALQLRLSYQQPFLSVWPAAMALGAHPQQVTTTQAQLRDMIEIVVQAVATAAAAEHDDSENSSLSVLTSSSVAQLSLGAVFVATELHMLSDTSTSPEFMETWAFLRQQLQHWEQLATMNPQQWLLPGSPSSIAGSGSMGDAWFVTSHVASALASGAASLVLPTSGAASSLVPPTVAAAAAPFFGTSSGSSPDGTDPSHYDAPPTPASTSVGDNDRSSSSDKTDSRPSFGGKNVS